MLGLLGLLIILRNYNMPDDLNIDDILGYFQNTDDILYRDEIRNIIYHVDKLIPENDE